MAVEIFEPQNPRWLEVLQKLRHDVYHRPDYVELDAKRSSAKAEAIAITEGENCLFVPYLLRSCEDVGTRSAHFDIISPYGYPGFLLQAENNSADFANQALEQLKDTLKERGVCTAFFRLHPILSNSFDRHFGSGTFLENGETVSVDLTLSEQELWAHTRKGHQSTINKCKRQNLTARMVSFAEYRDDFMSIYTETMDRVEAKETYYFDTDYFSALLELKDVLHLGIVELDGQIVCASLFFECGGIVQAHLGGTRTEFLKMSPFNLLLHHARLWAKDRGNEFLHLGGGIGGSKEDRLYCFKSGFSRQRHAFRTARFILDRANYDDLVSQRAKALGTTPAELLESQFFPAYRATLVPSQ